MKRILAQVRKELTQIMRDRLALVLALALPVGIVALLGTTISLTVSDIPIVIQDLDQTPLSRQYADAFRSSITFRVISLPIDASPETALTSGRARAALIIPEHFARDVLRGRNGEAQLLVDATDTNTALITKGDAAQVTSAFASDLLKTRTGDASVTELVRGGIGSVRVSTRLWFNPGREPRKFYGPGMFVLGLSIFPALLATLAMSREGEQQTILQVYVSSMSAHEFLVGKILAGMVIGIAEWILCLGVVFTLFDLGIAGDPIPFIVATLAFLFCGVAFGTLVGVAIPSQAAAMQAVQLGGFLLAFLLSGLIFPVENIPGGLRWLSNVVQARYYIVVVRDAFLQGAGWAGVWRELPPICAIGLVFYALAWRATRRMQVNT
jgi:drug efflux transport system permease protein